MAAINDRVILVYADWQGLDSIKPLGRLYVQHVRGKEIFSFEYDEQWMGSDYSLYLDPHLGFYKGKQYLPEEKQNFGLFLDSSPDRWGRLLMRRREALLARQDGRKENKLFETDYLLGVYDGHRMGGLRFKLSEAGQFLNVNKEYASPPWATLHQLELASLMLEKDDVLEDKQYQKWLFMLVDPGSSLGGARPKASVLDEKGGLWIAKFPSRNDTNNSGAWEMVLHRLAKTCQIIVPEVQIIKLSGHHDTFLSKRFDRTKDGSRIHFASAMTLYGHNDGDDHSDGASYLELVEFISRYSPRSSADLEQLWRRIIFNVLVSNTDDHLRNHGFLLTANGWRLSPAYDMNPNEYGTGLKLNISENNNALDIELVMEVAPYFKLSENSSNRIRKEMVAAVGNWEGTAKALGLSYQERESMKSAFRI